MNFIPRRAADGGVVLELFVTEEEASHLAATLRELIGEAKPPRQPAPWVPLIERESPKFSPHPSAAIRAEIDAKLGRRKP